MTLLTPYDYLDPEKVAYYENFYMNQNGNGLSVHKGVLQRGGASIGGLFKGLLKSAMPVVKSAGKSLLKTGLNVASDVLSGKNFKQSAKKRFKGAAGDILSSVASTINNPSTASSPSPRKKGRKRKGRDIFE